MNTAFKFPSILIQKNLKILLFSILILISKSNFGQNSSNLAPTPPMGWNSWNYFEGTINAKIVCEMADAMTANGMRDAGYKYLIIDDLWVGGRNNKNRLFADVTRFPDGIKAVADYVHAKGLKIGIYSNAAAFTCAGVTGSLGFEEIDAQTFAEWGIDYVKYDYCGAPTDVETAFFLYKKMGDALQKSGRNIVYSICEWGQRAPWLWAKAAGGHLWRTTYDSRDCWKAVSEESWAKGGIIDIFDLQSDITKYNGPNSWNDPDMLMVGLYGKGKSSNLDGLYNGCTEIEYQTHFALWCMLSAPLIVNSDLRNLDSNTLRLLINKDLIRINQDSLGYSAVTLFIKDSIQVLKKELSHDQYAICIFNRSTLSNTYSFHIAQDFKIWYPAVAYSIWKRKKSKSPTINGHLSGHQCDIFIIEKR